MGELNVVSFVNEGRRVVKNRTNLLPAVFVKIISFIFSMTVAMMLIYTEQRWTGFAIYAKEIVELILFILFVLKRRKDGTVL